VFDFWQETESMLNMPGSAMGSFPLAWLVAMVMKPEIGLSAQPGCLTTGTILVQKANLNRRSKSLEHRDCQQQPVRAAVAKDGQSATVSILLEDGQILQTYYMRATHIISADADLLAVVDQNVSLVRLSPVSHLFSSSKPGQVAKASIDSDGQVLGLFQSGRQILRVMPKESVDAPPALLETNERLHHVRVLDLHGDQEEKNHGGEKSSEKQDEEEKAEKEEEEDHGANSKPKLVVDDDYGDHSVLQPVVGDLLPSIESGVEAAWGGVKWFPGCYPGDSKKHIMKIGLAADVQAFQKVKSRATLQQILEQIVHETNIIYENQLNIKLEVGAIQIYETSNGAPAWARGCSSMNSQLDSFKAGVSQLPAMADWQLLTGCGSGSGTVGLAWVGTLCNERGYNTGVNQLINRRSGVSVGGFVDGTWRIFAHELGHNFAADHSFEDGPQRTGGIMDYGDGKLNGSTSSTQSTERRKSADM